jgi:metal-dependent amidase/aminoacylase/carboxypeptidase family protein
LNAAMIGLTAINSLRETFKDTDYVRVHPIITRGGDLVNVIPSDVRMETYVRGKSIEAIHSTNAKVDQALIAGAMALGAKVHIQDMPGYLPMVADIGLRKVIEDNMDVLIDADSIKHLAHRPGSTDFGDVSHLMPVAEISIGGFSGCPHGANFEVSDPELAYVTSSKLLALTAVDLLWGNADTANSIAKHYDPRFTIDKYLEYMDGLFSETIYGELHDF